MGSSRPTGAVVIPFRKLGQKDPADPSRFARPILDFAIPAQFEFSHLGEQGDLGDLLPDDQGLALNYASSAAPASVNFA